MIHNASPKVLVVEGQGVNVDRSKIIFQGAGLQALVAHYGATPWNNQQLWAIGLLESSIVRSDGTAVHAGLYPWMVDLPANSFDFDVLLLPDGEFATQPAMAEVIQGTFESFVQEGKPIYAYGSGIRLAQLAGLGEALSSGQALEVTGYADMAGDFAGTSLSFVAPVAGHIVKSEAQLDPPPGGERSVHTVRVVTSGVDDASLGVLLSDMLTVGAHR